VSAELRAAGFGPYGGRQYAGTYIGDAVPGVFVDRHVPEKRLFLLRSSPVPAILIETHHALDPDETARFARPETAEEIASALANALDRAL